MDVPIFPYRCAYFFRQFHKNVRLRIIDDCVHRVEPQSVEMIFLQPVKRIVDEEIPHWPALRSVKVYGLAPWRMVPVRKKLRRIGAEIVSIRTEVVVNHIQKNH